ncbi:MAG: hypothetical protein QM820_11940 [Minicystis sp.]
MCALRFLARMALAASLLALAGCSLALQTDDAQCSVDADCEARGGEFAGTVCVEKVCQPKPEPVDPKWGCVGKVEPLPSGKQDTLKVQLLDLLSQMPAKGVSVKLCNKYDPTCGSPLGTPTPDAMGWVSATVPSDAETYLEVTGSDYLPALVFLDHVGAAQNPDILLVPPSAAQGLAGTAGVTLDPSGGIILVRNIDCTGARTAGASVTIFPSSKETRFYVLGSAVTASGTKTDSSGNAGFVNVSDMPTANPEITGTVGPEGQTFGKVITLVRPGHVTFQILRPSANL